MKKVILIDGNNLLFRSYYATAYRGSLLRNSKGFPTNALYSFINMLNKIITEEKPLYMAIAFDKGKTFRHEMYDDYKKGRKETPLELKQQFPVAKEIAKAMGIPCFEIDDYEADDIIGTFAKEVDRRDDFVSTIISSDKDLLQLISRDNEVKLLKMNDFLRLDEESFIAMYGFTPDKMTDLKGLMGDSSDNIPGVKGIGEKGALSLIKKYGTLENLYDHIEEVKGKTKEKLLEFKDDAFFSKKLATICCDVPIDKDLDKISYKGMTPKIVPLLKEYEFFSLLKKLDIKEEEKEDVSYEEVQTLSVTTDSSIYIETEGNYHDKKLLGITISNEKGNFFIDPLDIKGIKIDPNVKLYTYDLKKLYLVFKYYDITLNNKIDDLMIEAYILNYPLKDDISYLMNVCGFDAMACEDILKKKAKLGLKLKPNMISKAKFIYDNRVKFYEELKKQNSLDLYEKMDLPLTYVLIDMEYTGVRIDKEFLLKMKEEVFSKVTEIENQIYFLAGTRDFNVMSPKQLGKVLFEDLEIPYPKRVKNDKYSTSVDILNKLTDYEIVRKILEYRTLTKLYSNYIVGLIDYIKEDGRIHTIFNQTLTRTGRLSSTSPNLQNIPIREEYGKLIRKAFIASPGRTIITSDYSQIELRVFAHMSNASNLIEAFNNDLDIHTKTAMDIYKVSKDEVTKTMRRSAKAVNFGIIYGISSFGLSEDLGVDFKEARKFIDNYLETYPGIKDYMNKVKESAHSNGYVKTLFGRVRVIEEINSTNFMARSQGERMALNTPIQGTAADIFKIAMININNELKMRNLKAKLIIQVHDELLIDCPNEELEEVTEIVKDKMEHAYKLKVPLKVDMETGNNWYEAK